MNEYTIRGITTDLIDGKNVHITRASGPPAEAWVEVIKERLTGHVHSMWGGELRTKGGGTLSHSDINSFEYVGAKDGAFDVVVLAGSRDAGERACVTAVGMAHTAGAELISA